METEYIQTDQNRGGIVLNMMKKALAVLLLLVAAVTVCACGNDASTAQQSGQKALPTKENILDTFSQAGYTYETVDNTVDGEMAAEGVVSYANYQLIRECSFPGLSDRLSDYCELHIYQLSDQTHAEQFYNTMLRYLNEEGDVGTLTQTNIQNGKRAVSKAPFGGGSYGASFIFSQQNESVILLHMDWDDYQDTHTEYDYWPEKILTDFGY